MNGEAESFTVFCPYCGEVVDIAVEPDVEGEMVWDCEVCCRPWKVEVSVVSDGWGPERQVTATRLDD